MATLVSDNFNRANDPTGLGTATTGQVWTTVAGGWSVNTNQALMTWIQASSPATSLVVIESGFTDGITFLMLPSVDVPNFAAGIGLVFRYVNSSYYWRLMTFDFPGAHGQFRLQRVYAGGVTTVVDIDPPVVSDGCTISVAYCGVNFEIFVNGVSKGTYDDTGNPQNYGTQCGLVSVSGSTFFDFQQFFDDFLVTTNADCNPPTYNCTVDGCVDPGDGSGTYATLLECQNACSVPVSYNCIDGVCIDPGDGTGVFPTLVACQLSGCGDTTHTAESEVFDAGEGSSYYIVPQISDSGEELRSKTIKSIRVTGIRSNASGMVFGYDVDDPIDVTDLETGNRSNTRMITRPQAFADSTSVSQSERKQVNISNAVLHTVRIEGDDTGKDQRDRIDEIVSEVAKIGVRR